MGDDHCEVLMAASTDPITKPMEPPQEAVTSDDKSSLNEEPAKKKKVRRRRRYGRKKFVEPELTDAIKILKKKTLDVCAKLLEEHCLLLQENEDSCLDDISKAMNDMHLQREEKQKTIKLKSTAEDATKTPMSVVKKARSRKKRNSMSERQLKHLYQKQINQIVRGTNSNPDDPKWENLTFKLGDDLEAFAQKCVDAGLGHIVEAQVRVNAKNNHQAFLSVDGESDPVISSMAARKYAMEGDTVRAFVRYRSESINDTDIKDDKDEHVESTAETETDASDQEDNVQILTNAETIDDQPRQSCKAFVISLVNELGNRVIVGSIAFNNPSILADEEYYKFKPRDLKVSMVYIPVESCDEFIQNSKANKALGYLYLAKITQITEDGHCIGKLKSLVGKCGDLNDETKAILLHNGLNDVKPFESRFEDMWNGPSTLNDDELGDREDLRKECIFTIDPLTARDLDDAVSCKILPNGNYEIGVHISDVSSFLQEKSELDELVKERATSIYLVNEVIHMLPQSLCMKCSLLPNEDKLAFSVFWEITPAAVVLSTRFTRSIIRSCTQLAYEHAQKIIDNPGELYTEDDLPTICNGFVVEDVVDRVRILNSLAVIMRDNRFANGSLTIQKPQYYFQFDPDTGMPISFETVMRLTANYLIEEFMLLANQSVAAFIYRHFPQVSFLRKHEPPKTRVLRNLQTKLSALGIDFDISSSKSIHEGLQKISETAIDPIETSIGLSYLLTKAMMRAKYYCSDMVELPSDMHHYALAIPIYTHFTSPIRRYPDIIVHRLLSAALKYTPPPTRTSEELHLMAHICNEQKWNARNAGEDSINLYFVSYVKCKKHIIIRAVVVDIYKHSIEVLTVDTGHLLCIQYKYQKVKIDASKAPNAIYISENDSTKPPIELKLFSPVMVRLMVWEGKLDAFFAVGNAGATADIDAMEVDNSQAMNKKKPKKKKKKTEKEKKGEKEKAANKEPENKGPENKEENEADKKIKRRERKRKNKKEKSASQ